MILDDIGKDPARSVMNLNQDLELTGNIAYF